MRLLTLNTAGQFSLEWFPKDKPLYAILSHTWGRGYDDEVTYKDITNGTGRDKPGFKKLAFCHGQAKADGLNYFWVDTCCIDKSNNNELSKAINSMFNWYRDAARCYVYLSDVSVRPRDGHAEWESALRNSYWFTRGWTLQELLAPQIVDFYSSEEVRLGDKLSLEQQIAEITGIATGALQGRPLRDFGVEERFSWIKKRKTTEEEDLAYCLLGIFSVSMLLNYGEGYKKAISRLRREIQESSGPDLYVVDPVLRRTMPFELNPLFTGRESELARLEELLLPKEHTSRVAIYGLGGVGKTQLAIELVYRTIRKYKGCSVFWIPATDPESLYQAYRDVARQLQIPDCDNKDADVKRLVQSRLSQETAGQWLMLFDNADDIEMWTSRPSSQQESNRLLDYLPRSRRGSIVFTTRDRKIAVKLAQHNLLEVQEMDTNSAEQLLEKSLYSSHLMKNHDHNKTLLRMLANLPLAISQASAYINENSISIVEYLSLFNEQENATIELLSEDFEDVGRYANIKNPVATTWLISFERIMQRDSLAAEYLSFIACVEPKNIPVSILPAGESRKSEIDAVGTLSAYSFVTKRPGEHLIDLHRLVHLATRNWLREKGVFNEWAAKVISRLDEIFPGIDQINGTAWRKLLPHAIYALSANSVQKIPKSWARITAWTAEYLSRDGRYREAEELQIQVLEAHKNTLGAEHPDMLRSMANLALTYWNQGRWKEAEELGVQVVEARKRVLGAEHPDTLIGIGNLASTYWNQGRWKEAEELHLLVVEARKRVLGAGHPDTLRSMANLASTYWNQGRWKEAEELQLQVVEASRRVLGAEHPDTLRGVANLASTYSSQGRWKEAEELEVQVVEACKKVLGAEHPETLRTISNLALTHWNQGRWKEAEELGVQVVESRKRVLGAEHPETLMSIANLASTYLSQGRWEEAEELGVQVVEARKRVQGAEHPETLNSMNNLAQTWKRQGKNEEALNLLDECVGLRSRILGPSHPYTLLSLQDLETWKIEKLSL